MVVRCRAFLSTLSPNAHAFRSKVPMQAVNGAVLGFKSALVQSAREVSAGDTSTGAL